MAYRGRGRGRGFGGRGGFSFAKQEPFISFPEGITLPDIKSVTVEENLVRRNLKLQNYWKASPYYLEDTISKRGQSADVERFSDRNKVNTAIRRDSLSQILEHKRFPAELTEGSKGWQRQPSRKRVRWNPDSGPEKSSYDVFIAELQKLDIFEKLEQREGQNEKGEKEKKEGENEEEDEDLENEDTEEEASDDDYNQNVDFDDDEDDFNIEDDGEDEQVY